MNASTKAEHTPGPWKLAPSAFGGLILERQGCMQSHLQIAPEADARLIAEAPAMLAALQAAERQFDAAIHCAKPPMHPLEYSKMLRATIARATGKE